MFLPQHKDVLLLWYAVNASLTAYTKLVTAFGDASQALMRPISDWQALGIHKSHVQRYADKASLEAFFYHVQSHCQNGLYQVLFYDEEDYPRFLHEIYDPPPLLFVKGNPKRLNSTQIAMVGSRKPSEYGKKITFDVAQYLVQAGMTITSGLAIGVDTAAHQGALAQSEQRFLGATVAVLGTGIDVCYPAQNQGLAHKIVQAGGCLVTEFLPATPASKHTFPRRNRLITGLCAATVVTEAVIQSGSLLSARLASEQGKQVFALPGRIDEPCSEGCHHLIREGATLFYHPCQIIEELRLFVVDTLLPKFTPNRPSDTFVFDNHAKPVFDNAVPILQEQTTLHTQAPKDPLAPELKAVYELVGAGADLDTLVQLSQMPTGELLAVLVQLEVLGWVNQHQGKYVKCL